MAHMDDVFAENRIAIEGQRRNIFNLRENIKFLRSDDFDALKLGLKAFSHDHTPKMVIDYISAKTEAARAGRQLPITQNALARLQTTLLIVEAQIALAMQSKPELEHEVLENVDSDRQIVGDELKGLVRAFGELQKQGLPYDAIEPVIIQPMNEAIDHFRSLGVGGIDPRFFGMDANDLNIKIAELRMDYATLELEANDFRLKRAGIRIDHAVYLEKAIDERVIDENPFIRDLITEKIAEAEAIINGCEKALDKVGLFMNSIFKFGPMEGEKIGLRPAGDYLKVPLAELIEFKP